MIVIPFFRIGIFVFFNSDNLNPNNGEKKQRGKKRLNFGCANYYFVSLTRGMHWRQITDKPKIVKEKREGEREKEREKVRKRELEREREREIKRNM